MELEEAVEQAITECIREGILSEFLKKNRAEAKSVSIYEYDMEKHMRMERAEAREEGKREGIKEGMKEGIKEGIRKGKKNKECRGNIKKENQSGNEKKKTSRTEVELACKEKILQPQKDVQRQEKE